jgi:tRNA-specific 2-thiouridylase
LVDPAEVVEELMGVGESRADAGQLAVQIRYNSAPQAAWLRLDPQQPSRFTVRFEEPQAGIAPGQAAVIYRGERVLGGGWISRSLVAADVEERFSSQHS